VKVLHHRALLLLRRLGHGRGSRQLCTIDLVGAAAKQVGQRKLQRWCAATVVVNWRSCLEQWLLLNRCLKHWLLQLNEWLKHRLLLNRWSCCPRRRFRPRRYRRSLFKILDRQGSIKYVVVSVDNITSNKKTCTIPSCTCGIESTQLRQVRSGHSGHERGCAWYKAEVEAQLLEEEGWRGRR
jgi:hypothetical protein